MNKGELIEAIAKETGLTKTGSEGALNATLSAIMKGAKKSPVQLVGFGTFKMVKSKARAGMVMSCFFLQTFLKNIALHQ